MGEVLLDPTDHVERGEKRPAPRLDSLQGKTVCLLDISKPKGNFFLDRVEALLRERYGVREVLRRRKPTVARPAPAELREEIVGRCDALIEALSD
jgi:hypothetical protein